MIDYKQKPKIVISEKTKKELDKLKIYPRETYEDIIVRLIKNGVQKRKHSLEQE